MSARTKIVVLKMKNLIYTAIFIGLGIILLILLIFMFTPSKKEKVQTTTYTPGVYTSSILLNNQVLDVEVTVDAETISSIRFVNLSDSVTTMFPLMVPAMDNISAQILRTQSTDDLSIHEEQKYTSELLIKTINEALSKAKNK